jgi:hypothetical protein
LVLGERGEEEREKLEYEIDHQLLPTRAGCTWKKPISEREREDKAERGGRGNY